MNYREVFDGATRLLHSKGCVLACNYVSDHRDSATGIDHTRLTTLYAKMLQQANRAPEAATRFDEALAIFTDPLDIVNTLVSAMDCAVDNRTPQKGMFYGYRAITIINEHTDNPAIARWHGSYLYNMARLCALTKTTTEAVPFFEQAVAEFHKFDRINEAYSAMVDYADLLVDVGELDAALGLCNEVRSAGPSFSVLADCDLVLSRLYAKRNDLDGHARFFARAATSYAEKVGKFDYRYLIRLLKSAGEAVEEGAANTAILDLVTSLARLGKIPDGDY